MIPPNFRLIAEIFKELNGQTDGRTDVRTDGCNDQRQHISAPMAAEGKWDVIIYPYFIFSWDVIIYPYCQGDSDLIYQNIGDSTQVLL